MTGAQTSILRTSRLKVTVTRLGQSLRFSEGSIILTDTIHTATGSVEKQKLVQLYLDQHFWVATHLTGPNRYSQFLYQISPAQKGGSYIDFTALHLEFKSEEDAKTLAERLCQADSAAWKLLAKAMTDELTKK